MKRFVFLFVIFIWTASKAHGQSTHIIDQTFNVGEALKLQDRFEGLGIAGHATNGEIQVNMFYASDYIAGNNTKGLIYGIKLLNQTSITPGGDGWTVVDSDDYHCQLLQTWVCSQNQSFISNLMFPELIPAFARKEINERTTTDIIPWTALELPVKIVITLTGQTKLTDISEIKLPGVEALYLKNLIDIVWKGDFEDQYVTGKEFMAVAHRGLWRNYGNAENSENALKAVNEDPKIDWIELDLRATGSPDHPHTILFHDDNPQKRLQGIWRASSSYPSPKHDKGIFDYPEVNWDKLKDHYLYDRFDHKTDDKISDLDRMFSFIKSEIDAGKKQKPIQLDMTLNGPYHYYDETTGTVISDKTWSNPETKINMKKYRKHIFLSAIGKVCQYGLTQYVNFKGRYTYNDPIWKSVVDTLTKYSIYHQNGEYNFTPKIAYLPRVGEELGNVFYAVNVDDYFNDWLEIYDHQKNGTATNKPFTEGVSLEGFEIRLKYIPDTGSTPDDAFQSKQYDRINQVKSKGLRFGLSSPAPFNCVGDQDNVSKDRARIQANFEADLRADLEWLLGSDGLENTNLASNRNSLEKQIDFIISDYPYLLSNLQNKQVGAFWDKSTFPQYDYTDMDLNEYYAKEHGFSVSFVGKVKDLKNKIISEVQHTSDNKVFLQFKMDENGLINVKRAFKNSATDSYSNWDLSFWEPVRARYTALGDNDEVFVMIIQEPKQVRIHIGMPDGSFDCLFFGYGASTSVLGQNWLHAPISAEQFDDKGKLRLRTTTHNLKNVVNHDHALCRTDAFKEAYNRYFKHIGLSENHIKELYPILNHTNIYRTQVSSPVNGNASDFLTDQKIYEDDVNRLGECTYSYGLAASNTRVTSSEKNIIKTIPEEGQKPMFVIYPNPSAGTLFINLERMLEKEENLMILLQDLKGSVVAKEKIKLQSGTKSFSWDFGGNPQGKLTNGVYIVQIIGSQVLERHQVIYDCGCN